MLGRLLRAPMRPICVALLAGLGLTLAAAQEPLPNRPRPVAESPDAIVAVRPGDDPPARAAAAAPQPAAPKAGPDRVVRSNHPDLDGRTVRRLTGAKVPPDLA